MANVIELLPEEHEADRKKLKPAGSMRRILSRRLQCAPQHRI
jgi:hypothetical protein